MYRRGHNLATVRCPHCAGLSFQLQEPDSRARECQSCGYTGTCALCGEPMSGEDSRHATVCSDQCLAEAAREDDGDRAYDSWVDEQLERGQ